MTAVPVFVSAFDLDFEVVGAYYAGDPGRVSGPPERCYPPEPSMFEGEEFFLLVEVPDDLSPNPRATRQVRVDIGELVERDDFLRERLGELALEKVESEIDEGPDGPEGDDDGR